MPTAPDDMPTWASDATYSSGPDVGIATRLEPTSGDKAGGFIRRFRAPARKFNWVVGLLCDWSAYLFADQQRDQGVVFENWVRRSPPGGYAGTLYGSTGGGGLFVSVGALGGIFTSGDGGVTWDERTAAGAYADDFRAAAYDGTVYVIVGENGEIQTSPGGVTWTARTAAGSYTGTFRGVASSGSLFVAVGDSGEIQTSPDGTTWTARTADASYAGQFNAVTYGNGLFVAVGGTGAIQTSPDGITWTARTAAASYSGSLFGAAYGGGVYVIAGASGEIEVSEDGATWTAVDAAESYAGQFNAVTFSGSMFVAVSGADIQTSTNGNEWTRRKFTNYQLSGVASDTQSCVAVGSCLNPKRGILVSVGPGVIEEIGDRRYYRASIDADSPVATPLVLTQEHADFGYALSSDEVFVPTRGRYAVVVNLLSANSSTNDPSHNTLEVRVAGAEVRSHRTYRHSSNATHNMSHSVVDIVDIVDPSVDSISLALDPSGGSAEIQSVAGITNNLHIYRVGDI